MKAAVYTRTGDKGTTGLYTGERVPKQSMRVEAYGTVDEISSALGLARATVRREDVRETIYKVQQLLMSLMADIASLNLPEPYIKEEHVKMFEETIDKFDNMLQPLSHFIIPGGTPGSAALDIARLLWILKKHVFRWNFLDITSMYSSILKQKKSISRFLSV